MPTLDVHPRRLSRAIQALIDNAVKFRDKDRPLAIHVGAEEKPGEWVFSVRDNGIGIEPKYFDKAFSMFQRLHPRDAYPGNGVGLSLAKRTIEGHGGRMWIESVPGEGSAFFFSLPKAR